MKYIYIYKKNDYAALLAAYLHLGSKSPTEVIDGINFMGIDKNLHEVYLLKYSSNKLVLTNLLKGIGEVFKDDIKVIDISKFDGIYYRIFKSGLEKELVIVKDR